MTAIFACICGKYDESQDFENDFKDKHGPLNKHVHFVVKMCFRFYHITIRGCYIKITKIKCDFLYKIFSINMSS
jgi:hypothetical protein